MKKRQLAACVALLGMTAWAQAQPFSQTYFLGDSLTDSGQFQGQRFTTNPGTVWSQNLAKHLGTDATVSSANGTNFAIGGARIAVDASTTIAGHAVPIASLNTQAAQMKAMYGNRLDDRALYTVWGGANDLFAVVRGAPAQQTITQAVMNQVLLINDLSISGANYILVPNIPDLGITPAFNGNEATGTQLSQTYNQALYEPFQNNNAANVIPLDVSGLLKDVVKDPARYGIKNVSTPACGAVESLMCGPNQLVEPDANQTYLFADGVHATTVANEAMSQYAVSVLTSSDFIAALAPAANQAGLAQMQHIERRLHNIAPLQDGKTAVWGMGGLVFGSGDGLGTEVDGTNGVGMVGVDKRLGNWTVGTYLAYDQIDGEVASHQHEQQRLAGGLYGRWQKDAVWVNGQIYYADLDVDTQRNIALAKHTQRHEAHADGDQYGMKISGGLNWQHGAVTHGPLVGLSMQKAKIKALKESGKDFSAMSFDEVNQESIQSSLGYQMNYQINPQWQGFASLQWQHEFKDGKDKIGASLNSVEKLNFVLPTSNQEAQDSGLLELGVNGNINEQWQVGAGVNAQFGDAANAQTAVYLNTSYRF